MNNEIVPKILTTGKDGVFRVRRFASAKSRRSKIREKTGTEGGPTDDGTELVGKKSQQLACKGACETGGEHRERASADELHLRYPVYGSMRLKARLRREGWEINRKRVIRLMEDGGDVRCIDLSVESDQRTGAWAGDFTRIY